MLVLVKESGIKGEYILGSLNKTTNTIKVKVGQKVRLYKIDEVKLFLQI